MGKLGFVYFLKGDGFLVCDSRVFISEGSFCVEKRTSSTPLGLLETKNTEALGRRNRLHP